MEYFLPSTSYSIPGIALGFALRKASLTSSGMSYCVFSLWRAELSPRPRCAAVVSGAQTADGSVQAGQLSSSNTLRQGIATALWQNQPIFQRPLLANHSGQLILKTTAGRLNFTNISLCVCRRACYRLGQGQSLRLPRKNGDKERKAKGKVFH